MGWYNFFGFSGFALGCGIVGYFIRGLKNNGFSETGAHQLVLFLYGIFGLTILVLYMFLDAQVEPLPDTEI